jgi:hypothetical protein
MYFFREIKRRFRELTANSSDPIKISHIISGQQPFSWPFYTKKALQKCDSLALAFSRVGPA